MHNILSVDAGNPQGVLLPLQILDYMETELFRFADEKGYLSKEKTSERSFSDKRLPLHKFFDTFAGTSMGGMVAAGYNLPDKEQPTQPALRSKDLMEMARKARPLFYEDKEAGEER